MAKDCDIWSQASNGAIASIFGLAGGALAFLLVPALKRGRADVQSAETPEERQQRVAAAKAEKAEERRRLAAAGRSARGGR